MGLIAPEPSVPTIHSCISFAIGVASTLPTGTCCTLRGAFQNRAAKGPARISSEDAVKLEQANTYPADSRGVSDGMGQCVTTIPDFQDFSWFFFDPEPYLLPLIFYLPCTAKCEVD